MLNVGMPKSPRKNMGIAAVCLTCMALPLAGATQPIPTFFKAVRHAALGYPETIETVPILGTALSFPAMALYEVAVVVAVLLGRSSAPARAAASVAIGLYGWLPGP